MFRTRHGPRLSRAGVDVPRSRVASVVSDSGSSKRKEVSAHRPSASLARTVNVWVPGATR